MRLFDQKRREIKFIEDIAGLRAYLCLLYLCFVGGGLLVRGPLPALLH